MGKALHDDVLSAPCHEIAEGTTLVVCSAEPANYAGVAAVALADIALTPGDGNGDFTVGNGDTSGRKVRVAAQSAINIDASGTATHVVIHDGARLLAVTTCTSQALTSGGTVTVPAHDYEFADPT